MIVSANACICSTFFPSINTKVQYITIHFDINSALAKIQN